MGAVLGVVVRQLLMNVSEDDSLSNMDVYPEGYSLSESFEEITQPKCQRVVFS